MHAGLMPNGRVIFLDKVENYTQIKLPDGQYAYSAEYDPETNKAVGIQYYVGIIALHLHSVWLTACSDQCFLLRWRFPSRWTLRVPRW